MIKNSRQKRREREREQVRGSFQRASYVRDDDKLIADLLAHPAIGRKQLGMGDDEPLTPETARKALDEITAAEEVWLSDTYQVAIRECQPMPGWPPLTHLSIRRLDREPLGDWRELQRIKNELIGLECEFVNLHPADSRLVDGANQTHLWGFTDPAIKFPFGFQDRLVINEQIGNSKQRPL